MISLRHDTMSFTFPKIARNVRSLVERKIQQIASELPAAWDRAELLSRIESYRDFDKLEPARKEAARSKIQTWTPAHIEACLREFAFNYSGLGLDSFTSLSIKFQRTMRLPDTDVGYPLSPELGQLPLRSVDDFPETAPAAWAKSGGVAVPLNRSEALWIWFSSRCRFAVRIKFGEINALSGEPWSAGFHRQPQNYLIAPNAPWEDGNEVVRRLVAIPLGALGTSVIPAAAGAEGNALQFEITPLRAESVYRDEHAFLLPPTIQEFFMRLIFAPTISKQLDDIERRHKRYDIEDAFEKPTEPALVAGRQKIQEDPYQLEEWDKTQTVRCFVHACGPHAWRRITGMDAPYPPLTATGYLNAGIPWSDDYRDDSQPLPKNSSITPKRIAQCRNTSRFRQIREFLDAS